MELTEKEISTIVFALEEYAQTLEKEGNFKFRNQVYELIPNILWQSKLAKIEASGIKN
jgi:hypothetical protein